VPTIVRMPEVVANATEAALVSWLIATGEEVSAGDEIAEIETEKALVSVIAEESGILARQLAEPGQTVEVGAVIAVISRTGESEGDVDGVLASTGLTVAAAIEQAAAPDDGPVSVGSGATPHTVPVPPAPVEPSDEETSPRARLFISPIARKLAKELGVSPAGIRGTGPTGRIVRRDVEAAARSQASVPDATPLVGATPASRAVPADVASSPAPTHTAPAGTGSPDSGRYTDIPHTGMRKAIARRLTESKSTVPHFYLTATCRVDDLLALRTQINETAVRRISVNDLIVKAVAGALIEVPEANVTWADDALRSYSSADVSIAVAIPGGLVTPVIRGADARSLTDLSAHAADLAERGRAGRLKQDEIVGGSFSVSNLGMYGTEEFSAILNPPQAGILAVGAAVQKPVVIAGEITVATVLTVTLSADHRAIDGAAAAQWLAAFTRRIENPISILV